MVAITNAPRAESPVSPQVTTNRAPAEGPEKAPSLETLAKLLNNSLVMASGPSSFQSSEVKSAERKLLADSIMKLTRPDGPENLSKLTPEKMVLAGMAVGAAIAAAMQKDPKQAEAERKAELERREKEETARKLAAEREAKEKAELYAKAQEERAEKMGKELARTAALNEEQRKKFILKNLTA